MSSAPRRYGVSASASSSCTTEERRICWKRFETTLRPHHRHIRRRKPTEWLRDLTSSRRPTSSRFWTSSALCKNREPPPLAQARGGVISGDAYGWKEPFKYALDCNSAARNDRSGV